jgi:hypothetical protein
MAKFRHACGECRYMTGWLPESEADRRMLAHYDSRHPGIEPGGGTQIKQSSSCCCSSLVLSAIAVFFLAGLVATSVW